MHRLRRRFYFLSLKKFESKWFNQISHKQKLSHKCPIPTYIHNIIHRLRKQKKQYIYTQTNTHARANIVMLAVKAKQILLMQDDTQHTHSSPSCFSKILSVTHGMPPSLHWMRFDFKYVPSFYRTQVDHFIPLSKTETVLSPVFSLDLNSGYSMVIRWYSVFGTSKLDL